MPEISSTGFTPSQPASGPVTANESGARPSDSSQSTLFTRPRSSAGTTRCISVTQTIRPPAQQPSPANEIAIACHGTSASAKAAIWRQATIHSAYMNVMWRRGSPICPITSETRIALSPPAANTSPRSPASPPSSLRTRNGSSTVNGP